MIERNPEYRIPIPVVAGVLLVNVVASIWFINVTEGWGAIALVYVWPIVGIGFVIASVVGKKGYANMAVGFAIGVTVLIWLALLKMMHYW